MWNRRSDKERKRDGKLALFPIRLDDAAMETNLGQRP